MSRLVSRHGYAIAIAALAAAICIVGGFLVLVAAPDLGRTAVVTSPSPAAPSPTPRSAMALSPVGIEMPADADCAACHETTDGTVGTKDIPELAHPLWGWRDCTACHAPGRLVATAPGHSGLHKDECLVCHKVPETAMASAAPRPHHVYEGKTCLDCHGKQAPLPTDMAGRTNCWVCHSGADTSDLFGADGSGGPSRSPAASPAASPSAAPGGISGALPGAGSTP